VAAFCAGGAVDAIATSVGAIVGAWTGTGAIVMSLPTVVGSLVLLLVRIVSLLGLLLGILLGLPLIASNTRPMFMATSVPKLSIGLFSVSDACAGDIFFHPYTPVPEFRNVLTTHVPEQTCQ